MALLDPNSKKTDNIIKIVSVVIPIAVAGLFGIKVDGVDLTFLPPIYAGINAVTALFLLIALFAIKAKNKKIHQLFIQLSMMLSVLFLLCYVAYHITSTSTEYGGDMRGLYFFILISHILLSVAVIPIVLYTYKFAWQGNFEKHKKWTRFAWPIWFYVAVSGVVVYQMISPFY